MLTIDGSTLEGGGQLTRLSLCLAAITKQPIRIHSIRAGRSAGRLSKGRGMNSSSRGQAQAQGQRRDANVKGRDRNGNGGSRSTKSEHQVGDRSQGPVAGLKDSHLAALTFLAEMVGATVEGGEVGSPEVVFRPSLRPLTNTKTEHTIALSKPGSIWLIFQAIYPYLCFCTDWSQFTTTVGDDNEPCNTPRNQPQKQCITLRLHGGTNVPKAMSTEYMTQVFAPLAERISLPRLEIETVKAGWAGNTPEIGEVVVRIFPPTSPSSSLSSSPKQPQFLILNSFTLNQHLGPKSITHVTTTIIADTSSIPEIQNKLTTLLDSTYPTTPISTQTTPSGSPRRLYILVVAHTDTGILGCDYLGGGARPKTVTEANRHIDDACRLVVRDLVREVAGRGPVDRFMVDQLVVFQALAKGMSSVGACLHGDGGGNDDGDGQRCVSQRLETTCLDDDDDDDARDIAETGDRKENGIDAESEDNADEEEESADNSGSLHARTVRWVCGQILLGRHGYRRGPRHGNRDQNRRVNRPGYDEHASEHEREHEHEHKDGDETEDTKRHQQHSENDVPRIKFQQGGICHGIGWNSGSVV